MDVVSGGRYTEQHNFTLRIVFWQGRSHTWLCPPKREPLHEEIGVLRAQTAASAAAVSVQFSAAALLRNANDIRRHQTTASPSVRVSLFLASMPSATFNAHLVVVVRIAFGHMDRAPSSARARDCSMGSHVLGRSCGTLARLLTCLVAR
jgi:hypothetical protein